VYKINHSQYLEVAQLMVFH